MDYTAKYPVDFTAKDPVRRSSDEPAAALAALARVGQSDYPGVALRRGSRGAVVGMAQARLNAVRAKLYPQLGYLQVDNIFGAGAEKVVRQYQALKGLSADGVLGRATWNALQKDYESLSGTGSGDSSGSTGSASGYPGTLLSRGSSGPAVANMQTRLNVAGGFYSAINKQTVDGKFGDNMAAATRRFQKQFGLSADEVIGPDSWNKIVSVSDHLRAGIHDKVQTRYPGSVQQKGSSGDSVRFIQSYLNRVRPENGGNWPLLTVDGQFGSITQQAVVAFQASHNLKMDGKVGSATWQALISAFNNAI